MGFNISGIAVDKRYENDLVTLQSDLNLTLEFLEDVIFETACANWTDEGICYVYFSKESTLLFLNMDMCIDAYPVENKKSLTFALSEISMAFSLNYCEGKEVKRSIIEHDGRKMSQQGTPFDFEGECDDSSEIIWKKLDHVLDVPYHSIDLGASAKKYKVSVGRPAPVVVKASVTEKEVANPVGEANEKPWWKFW